MTNKTLISLNAAESEQLVQGVEMVVLRPISKIAGRPKACETIDGVHHPCVTQIVPVYHQSNCPEDETHVCVAANQHPIYHRKLTYEGTTEFVLDYLPFDSMVGDSVVVAEMNVVAE